MIYPQSFEQKIGFGQIRQLLKEKCLSTLGEERVTDIAFSDRFSEVKEHLDQTFEFVRVLQEEDNFPAQYSFDIRPSLGRTRMKGMYLDKQELFDLRRSLEAVRDIVRFLQKSEGEEEETASPYPCSKRLTGDITVFPQLTRKIDDILSPYGKIKDNAPAELACIHRELVSTMRNTSRSLNNILRNAQSGEIVDKDVAPTIRNGRLIIPIVPALKRKIRGVVYDESASGKTVFIEPAEVVEADNRIRKLEGDERWEIIRILVEFFNLLHPSIPDILLPYEFLVEMGFVRAEALFSEQTTGLRLAFENKQILDWAMAVHPLLQLSLVEYGKKVVPLDIELSEKQRIFITSGPDADGRSVCLKTVGLLQYMLQYGLLIPTHKRSHAGIFSNIFVDIGDEQSIEDGLSTYSSHLTSMKIMMENYSEHSLILIDKFGGGTEPQIGGAIAETVLKHFNQGQAFGVITTHYQNLKHFAEDHEGVIDDAMLYNRHLMQALFQLQIGNPGSSFAVEITRKIGLPEDVVADASEIVGSEYINADRCLQDIVRDKRYWEGKRQTIRQRERHIEETITRYQTEVEDLQKSREKILRKAREEVEQLIQEANARIENAIRTIEEVQAEKEKIRQARQGLADFRQSMETLATEEQEGKIARKIEKLKEKQNREKEKRTSKDQGNMPSARASAEQQARKEAERLAATVPGSNVRIKGQTSVGEVMEINGKDATVTFGSIRTTVKLDRLEHTNAQPKQADVSAKSTYINPQTQDSMYEKKLNFKQDVDVRGMHGDEALQVVTYFIDDATLVGMSRAHILHGTGMGILHTLIHQYLQTVPGISHLADGHIQSGGAGVMVVDLS